MLQYKIEFPVGDWSDDGHGKCDYYIIESNKSAKELAAIHKRDKEILGFSIGDIACDYEEPFVPSHIVNVLIDRNFPFIDVIEDLDWAIFYDERDRADLGIGEDEVIEVQKDEKMSVTSEEVFKIWLWCLQQIDPTFEYKISKSDAETIYGVSSPGYGCFN